MRNTSLFTKHIVQINRTFPIKTGCWILQLLIQIRAIDNPKRFFQRNTLFIHHTSAEIRCRSLKKIALLKRHPFGI